MLKKDQSWFDDQEILLLPRQELSNGLVPPQFREQFR